VSAHPFFRPFEKHRPPVVSLIDYGSRGEVPVRGEAGSNGLITPRSGVRLPGSPVPTGAEIQQMTRARVQGYVARHQDGAYRAAHGLDTIGGVPVSPPADTCSAWRTGLAPGARRERGSYAGAPRDAAAGNRPATSTEPLAPSRLGSLIGVAIAGMSMGLSWGAVAFVLAYWRHGQPDWLFTTAVAIFAAGIAIGSTAIVAVAAEGRTE